MKNEIVEKLFSDTPLNSDEILLVVNALKEEKPAGKLPFSHNEGNVFEACGIQEKDVEVVNTTFRNVLDKLKSKDDDGDDVLPRLSVLVEVLESLAKNDPVMLRLLIVQTVKMNMGMASLHGSLGDMIRKLLGGKE